MKKYNSIIESLTEPSKNNIWLKDGKFKIYNRGEWKDIMGSSSNIEYTGSEPYYYHGEASEKVKDELLKCVRTGRDIIYFDTDEGTDDNYYHTCISACSAGTAVVLMFAPVYEKGGFTWVVTDEQAVKLNGLIPNKTFNGGTYTPLYCDIYNNININYDTVLTFEKSLTEGAFQKFQGQLNFENGLYQVTFPNTVKWSTDSITDYKEGNIYQFTIINNLGVMKEFSGV